MGSPFNASASRSLSVDWNQPAPFQFIEDGIETGLLEIDDVSHNCVTFLSNCGYYRVLRTLRISQKTQTSRVPFSMFFIKSDHGTCRLKSKNGISLTEEGGLHGSQRHEGFNARESL